MTKALAIVLAAFSLTSLWRESNSRAASERGTRAYAKRDYKQAVRSFGEAAAAAPSPAAAFNLGTAQVAAGDREAGAAELARAMSDPSLRASALYNRGNGALAAKAYDHAIRDYRDALRLRPGDLQAKRNLEIALRKREEQRRQSQSGGGQGNNPQPPPRAQKPQHDEKRGEDQNAEALLRAVQQQEQEELSRMKRSRPRERVGW
jgi:tetratricopeptide (TPR) repeat protein